MNNIVYAGVIPVVLGLVGLIKQFFGDALFPTSPDRRAATLQFLAIGLAVIGSAIVYWATSDHTERQGLLYALGWGLVAGMAAVGAYHVSGQSGSNSAILTSAVGTLQAQPVRETPLHMTLTADTSQAEAAIGSLSNQVSDLHDGIDALHTKLDALPTTLPLSAPVPTPAPVQPVVVTSSAATPEPVPVAPVAVP